VNKITTLGVDLAKSIFQLHGINLAGKVVLRREVRRAQLMKSIAQLEPCLIGIEACGSAHYWARRFGEHGHQVKMMRGVAPLVWTDFSSGSVVLPERLM